MLMLNIVAVTSSTSLVCVVFYSTVVFGRCELLELTGT